MRIVSIGRLNPEPSLIGTWMLAGMTDEQRAAIRQEATSAYGFLLEAEDRTDLKAEDILYRKPSGEEQMAWKLAWIDRFVGFFIHEYTPGSSLYIRGQEVYAPPVTNIAESLSSTYIPPSTLDSEGSYPSDNFRWFCSKCRSTEFTLSELRGSSGGFTAHFNWDTAIFTAVTCRLCYFTDFYNMPLDSFQRRFDLDKKLIKDHF